MEQQAKNPIICNTPNKIELFQFLARRSALGLEIKGIGRRGQSAYSICKQAYGLKGTKQSVFEQMTVIRDKMKQAAESNNFNITTQSVEGGV